MRRVFGDAFYFFALLNDRDQSHARAVTWSQGYSGQLVTAEWVLIEVADGLASTRQRAVFAPFRHRLLAEPTCEVVPLTPALYEQAVNLYAARPDKAWSLTDCLSFVVMQREVLTEALTGDHHFEQAGFVALLK